MIVTANLSELATALGLSTTPGYVTFRLVGYDSNLPCGNGSLLVAFTATAKPDEEGNIAVTLIGNDLIQPKDTSYEVELFTAVGGWLATRKFRFSGDVDLSDIAA